MVKNYHYHKLFEFDTDKEPTWSCAISLLCFNRASPQIKLKVYDGLVTSSTEITSTFNNHFYSVALVRNVNSPSLPDDPTAYVKIMKNSFIFLNTVADEI